MGYDKTDISERIKEAAYELGFDACGFCRADSVDDANVEGLRSWLDASFHGQMAYMEGHFDKRCNPALLVEGAKSVVSLALNYYPAAKQAQDAPQFAYYAYGKDYHDVMKAKLTELLEAVKQFVPGVEGRVFCDTAPLLERYWAARSGIGFIGKNSLLIIPKKGSFFFLGELIINIELDYGSPLALSCGNCRRCLDACPTGAIVQPGTIDARRCISYQTIENKGEIDDEVIPKLSNRFYGCDICQLVCPWNRYARPHTTRLFDPSQAFLDLSAEKLEAMTVEDYQVLFKGSAVKRAKYSGLKRNMEALKRSGK